MYVSLLPFLSPFSETAAAAATEKGKRNRRRDKNIRLFGGKWTREIARQDGSSRKKPFEDERQKLIGEGDTEERNWRDAAAVIAYVPSA